ncbi:hypothetical protein GQ43DRAFT_445286 [Delitschia confertaspora ATCC 74209]|uniref:DNA (cytosine-5)-methyltransferase 1 replication foci domain-containing protein n=1 Tax=Delitschia confertaspora ATCC 74209 TaxID=1513339 RepID=A0A9P4MMM3_9PLEO|nr:hypothetical protein GQ43DRAFT_445286 [Delitschia confertaspora ATCC 74209]
MLTSELSVLKPIDPSISNADDYEIFTLSNAQVTYVKDRKPASLLVAYADTPLIVTGKLETPDRSQQNLLLKKPYKPIDIEIKDVTRFSYGQTTDGGTVLWALGKAGWFELRPSPAYKEIFEEMEEAVQALYFVTDIYAESKLKGNGPAAELIFQEYAEDKRFPCSTLAQARAIFHKHRQFLMVSMLNKAQGMRWGNTPVYLYYKKHFANDFNRLKARVSGKDQEGIAQPDAVVVKPKPSKPKEKTSQQSSNISKKDDNWWQASVIWEFMQKAVSQGAIQTGHVTIERVAALLVKRFEVDDSNVAKNIIHVHASNILYMMEHPRRRTAKSFLHEPIHAQLSAGHSLSAVEVRRTEQMELRPRKTYQSLKDYSSDEDEKESSAEEATPRRRVARPSNKGKFSSLRPKNGRISGKGKGKSVKQRDSTADATDDDEEMPDADVLDTPTVVPQGKRKHASIFLPINPRKRAASESGESSSPTSLSESEGTEPTDPLPLRWRSGNIASKSSTPALPPIVPTPLPSYTANAPGDTWVCTFDGCVSKVYAASGVTGRGLIKEHLQEHVMVRQAQLDIVMSEEQKLRLPVNNLLKRIREMAEHQQPILGSLGALGGLGAASTNVAPAPVERSI